MQQTVKALVRSNQLPAKPLFMPLIFAAAARVAGLSPQQFYTNPTKIANGLRQLQGPLRCDVLCCYADQTLIAEALGAALNWEAGLPRITAGPAQLIPVEVTGQGRVPVMLDVVGRLRIMLRDRVGLAVALPGPWATATYLFTPTGVPAWADYLAAAGGTTLQAARAVCEAGADLILLIEPELPATAHPSRPDWSAMLETICNVIRFHEALPVLLMPQGGSHWPETVALGALPCLSAAELAGPSLPDSPYGLALPVPTTLPPEVIVPWKNQNCALITTAGDLPYELEAKMLRSVVADVRQIRDNK
jgi:uroporphyrinogen-III decarboxylase